MRKLNEEDPRHRLNHTVLNAIREDRDISKDSAKSCRGFISGPRSGIENQSETPYHRDMSQIEELLKVCVPRGFKASTKQMGAFLDAGRTHHPFEINHSLFCDG